MAQQAADGVCQWAGCDMAPQFFEGLQGVFPQRLGFPAGLLCPGPAHGHIDPDDNAFDGPACFTDPVGSRFGQLAQPGCVSRAGNHHDDLWSIDTGHTDLACQGRRQRACQHGLYFQQFAHGLHHVRALGMAIQPFQRRRAGRSVPAGRRRHGHEEVF